ncbi:hypothetical protein [Janthinobacterium sp. HH106]|uniref:hypothetical protein n=1 Tax=Janthinobacterium sp. HH106 TaxID=1537278 RepID=UPI0015863495|nr:hypothetical protein [Janthinobacterium sp. HH106]
MKTMKQSSNCRAGGIGKVSRKKGAVLEHAAGKSCAHEKSPACIAAAGASNDWGS